MNEYAKNLWSIGFQKKVEQFYANNIRRIHVGKYYFNVKMHLNFSRDLNN